MKGFAEQCMAEYDLDGWRVRTSRSRRGQLSRHAELRDRPMKTGPERRRSRPVHFRRVMSRFATGVTVVVATAKTGAETRGMTVNAFLSGSLDPPLCVVSIGRRSQMHLHLLAARTFSVNILCPPQPGGFRDTLLRAACAGIFRHLCVARRRAPTLAGASGTDRTAEDRRHARLRGPHHLCRLHPWHDRR